MKTFRTGLTIMTIAIVTGCAPMNGSFNCNKVGGEGAGCVSLDEINKMADQGKFNQRGSAVVNSNSKAAPTSIKEQTPNGYPVATPFPGAPVRYGDSVQQLWIAPYADTDGNYHEPSYVYFVLKPGYWIGVPPTAVTGEE